jgi:ATP-dependent DNA helicase RecG
MSSPTDLGYLQGLVTELRKLPAETGWVEFKEYDSGLKGIGEDLAGLSNAAALAGQSMAYLVWGLSEPCHQPTGTTIDPKRFREECVGIEGALNRHMRPACQLRSYQFEYEGRDLLLWIIPCAADKPTEFSRIAYLRVGGDRMSLNDSPELAENLASVLAQTSFENQSAIEYLDTDDVQKLIDLKLCESCLQLNLPDDIEESMKILMNEGLIEQRNGFWAIRNHCALLFGRRLSDFPHLNHKAITVAAYHGVMRYERKVIVKRRFDSGYASAVNSVLDEVVNVLPHYDQSWNSEGMVTDYPRLAARELLVNCMIHQDLRHLLVDQDRQHPCQGPTIEIFEDRIEFSNVGSPLVDRERILNCSPKARNTAIVSMMQKMGHAEGTGMGIERVVTMAETLHLRPPSFLPLYERGTLAILYPHKPIERWNVGERTQACYMHACLKYLKGEEMTNSSLRERLGVDETERGTASNAIREALSKGKIKSVNTASKRYASYLPFWA